jgi:hypothetical protein
MARIVSAGFETESGSQASGFTIPRRVADFLRLREGARVEGRVLFEGRQIEFAAEIGPNLQVGFDQANPASDLLRQLSPSAKLTVTLWPEGELDAPEPRRARHTPEEVVQAIRVGAGEAASSATQTIVDWARGRDLEVLGGRGEQYPSLRIYGPGPDRKAILWIWAPAGELEFPFRRLPAPLDTIDAQQRLLDGLNAIPGMPWKRGPGPVRVTDKWHTASVAAFGVPERWERLERLLDEIVEALRATAYGFGVQSLSGDSSAVNG